MALTAKQVYDLNNMNVASQNVSLGSFLLGTGGEAGVHVVTPAEASDGELRIPFTGGSVIDRMYVAVGRGDADVNVTVSASGSYIVVSGSSLQAGDLVNYFAAAVVSADPESPG